MKSLLFSVREEDKPMRAIPVAHIKELSIENVGRWCKEPKDRWLNDYNYGYYYVYVAYEICTGAHAKVFTADTEEECIEFINSIYE